MVDDSPWREEQEYVKKIEIFTHVQEIWAFEKVIYSPVTSDLREWRENFPMQITLSVY